MLYSLRQIHRLRQGDKSVLREHKWLQYLALTDRQRVNLERVGALDFGERNLVLDYVARTLERLEAEMPPGEPRDLLEEALAWCETAKGGLPHQRESWLRQGIPLFAHNLGSARLYRQQAQGDPARVHLVSTLIETHGLVGQALRGEVPLAHNRPLYHLVRDGYVAAGTLQSWLICLNSCVVGAVEPALWRSIRPQAEKAIGGIVAGDFPQREPLEPRLRRLRAVSIAQGEDFGGAYRRCVADAGLEPVLQGLLEDAALWYVEAALYDFSFGEFVKILLLIAKSARGAQHISFEPLMRDLYYNHQGKKHINLYKKRVMEQYLAALAPADILAGTAAATPHVEHRVETRPHLPGAAFFRFHYSPAGEKLMAFCVEAEKAGLLYEKAVILLMDLFQLRRDPFDRFHNQGNYLSTMNGAMEHKQALLPHIRGGTVLDIGPGGGGLMDLICATFPEKRVLGLDFSQNVVENLQKRKRLEHRPWEVLYGDALHLGELFQPGQVDTVIFCSVLHELYSYIAFEGKSFNRATLAAALSSAYEILPAGGRLLIRDGIMTEPDAPRVLQFASGEGMAFLRRYAQDFRGRSIRFEVVGQNRVRMPVNDAMEFLYTYTWGEESYIHEVNEQFGYFTPGEYAGFLRATLGPGADILLLEHFLQDGYEAALSPKVAIFDGAGAPAPFPDSTCIIVVEKGDPPSPAPWPSAQPHPNP